MYSIYMVFCLFLILLTYLPILRADPLSHRLLFRGPTESLQIHTQHNHKQSQTIELYLYTHTVWLVAAIFLK